MQTKRTEVTQEILPPRTRRPLRTKWTGRSGGSGAQPPLHLIYMVKVGRRLPETFKLDYFVHVRNNSERN